VHPSGEANGLRMTLRGYDDDVAVPPVDYDDTPGHRLVAFDVFIEKEGRLPRAYAPVLFSVDDCGEFDDRVWGIQIDTTWEDGPIFHIFWGDGGEIDTRVYFEVPAFVDICELEYSAGAGGIEFLFLP
jgi:hypothetical protein